MGIVDKTKWITYSDQAESRIITSNLMKKGAFKQGLKQLKNLISRITGEPERSVTTSSLIFTPRVGGRSFRALNKDHLQKEEEENNRLFVLKIREQSDLTFKFKCMDCSWKGKYLIQGKAHARSCGQRRQLHIKKMNKKAIPVQQE